MVNHIARLLYSISTLLAIVAASSAAFAAVAAAIAGILGVLLGLLSSLGAALVTSKLIDLGESSFASIGHRIGVFKRIYQARANEELMQHAGDATTYPFGAH